MSTSNSSGLMQKVVATLLVIAALMVMASFFVPSDSSAADETVRDSSRAGSIAIETMGEGDAWSDNQEDEASEDPHSGLACLGTVKGVGFEVQIYQTHLGVRYSVIDRATGELKATLVTAERVAQLFPEMPLPGMNLDEHTLMLAVPVGYDGNE